MNKKSGFTLIEILAVVTIIGLIFILVIPKITTSLKNKKGDVDRTTENLVLSATKLYVSEHSSKFEKTDGNISCMPLHQLVRKGYLDGPVKNVTDDSDITNGKSVRITYNKGFKYELVDSGKCSVVYNEVLVDNEGNKYIRVEYLESTGTQYIDTGYKPNSNTKIELEYLPSPNYSGFMTIYGTQNNQSSGRFYGLVSGTPYYLQVNFSNNNSPTVWGFNKDGTSITGGNGTFSPVLQRVKLSVDKSSVKIESQEYSNTYDMTGYSTWGNEVDCNHNLTIFARSTAGVVSNNFSGKIYYFKIYDNDNLVRDFIPVLDRSGRPCMFDNVEKTCFYNRGEEEFGYSINEDKYTEGVYLESTGIQYIDTGYKPNSNTKIELEYLPSPNYSGFMTIYGTQNNQSSGRFYGLVSGTPYYLQVNFSNNNSPTVWGFNKDGTSITGGNGTFSPVLQRVKLSVDKSSVKIESQEYSNTYDMTGYSTWGNEVDCNHNLTIFARSTAGVVSNNFSGKIYYFKIYDNDNLVRDFIPVLDRSGRPCLLDKVENKYYYNQGTGEFLWR